MANQFSPVGLVSHETTPSSRAVLDSECSDQAIASPRECDCPPWVMRCAHLPEGVLQWCAPDAPPPSEHGQIIKRFPPGAEAVAVEFFITEEERRLRGDA